MSIAPHLGEIWGFEYWVFAHFGPLSLDNRKSDFRFLYAVREISWPAVDRKNLSEIALHSFEKHAIKVWKIANLGVGHFWRGVYPLLVGVHPTCPLPSIEHVTVALRCFEWWGSAPN